MRNLFKLLIREASRKENLESDERKNCSLWKEDHKREERGENSCNVSSNAASQDRASSIHKLSFEI